MLLFNFQTSFCLQRDTVVVAYYILICFEALGALGNAPDDATSSYSLALTAG